MASQVELWVSQTGVTGAAGPSPVSTANPVPTQGPTGTSADQVQGTVASGAADAGNPVKVGGKYNATPPTFSDLQRGDLQIGARGSLHVEMWSNDGNTPISTTSGGADTIGNGNINASRVSGYDMVFNGTTWDRARGDINGAWATPPSNYETVAASQTAQVLGATGATGDYIERVIIVPATTAPGVVTLIDNATSIPLWVGGTVGTDLKPFTISLGMKSTGGAWKITTGANVSVIGTGRFT